MPPPTFFISIIIATYNRAHIIDHCLQSLVEQTASQDDFEVIVIDNNSTDNTHDMVQKFQDKITNLTIINEVKQGAGHARNAGITIAQGAWIACLDSDAKAHKNWVEIILREVKKDTFDIFGGPYLAWHHYGTKPHWFSEKWENSSADFDYYGTIPKHKTVPTSGNAVFRKDITQAVGFFPTHIGMIGNTCAYGEETKLFEDMRNTGFRLGSVPDLIIDHCVLPYKYSMKWRLKSAFAHGVSLPFINAEYARFIKLPRLFMSLVWRILRLPLYMVYGVKKKHAWQRILLDYASPPLWTLGVICTCLQAQKNKGNKK